MPDVKPRLLKGFRDYLPETQLPKDQMLRTIASVFESFGYAPIQTPALEYAEVLTGKYGEEGDKLLYRFDDHGKRSIALRYDLTVPLARVLGQYGTLETPFKRYQIGPVWRAEKPARGRFREFVQCDADIAGSSSPLADVEVLQVACTVFEKLGVKGFRLRVSNRKLLTGLLVRAGVDDEDAGMAVIRTIDKLDKLDEATIRRILAEDNGLSPVGVDTVFEFLGLADGAGEDVLDRVEAYFEGVEVGLEGAGELRKVMQYIEATGFADRVHVDLSLARGMDYYTGTIAEGVLTDLPGFGSVLGGGRYDGLVGRFRGQSIPAVGISVGVDRLLAGLQELELVPAVSTPTQVLVTIFDQDSAVASIELASELRAGGLRVELAPDATKLGKQFKFADRKGIPMVLVLGPDEIMENKVAVKDLRAGTQETIDRTQLAEVLRSRLAESVPAELGDTAGSNC